MTFKNRFINAMHVASLMVATSCGANNIKLNKLSSIEVSKSNISTQIMFEFEEPIYFQRAIDTQKHQLTLTFPGMTAQQFKAEHVTLKLAKLKKLGIVTAVSVTESLKPFARIDLLLTFRKDPIMVENDTRPTTPNGFLIRWSKMEDPNRLIFDIFSMESLEEMRKTNSFVLTAQNEVKKKAFYPHHLITNRNA